MDSAEGITVRAQMSAKLALRSRAGQPEQKNTMSQTVDLERILESAIVASWPDFTLGTSAGLIHIEYGCAAGGTLDYLKVLSSLTRGHWLLGLNRWAPGKRCD